MKASHKVKSAPEEPRGECETVITHTFATIVENGAEISGNEEDATIVLNKELELLKKKLKILELKQRISMLETSTTTTTTITRQPAKIKFEEISEKFSGDNADHIVRWYTQLERAFLPYKIDDTTMLYNTRRLLTGTAGMYARSIDVTSYDELKANLLQTFSKNRSVESVYKQLRTRRLARNESMTRYVLEMQVLAFEAPIPEEELINIIIDGIGDPINTATFRFAAQTVEDLKPLLKKYEQIRPRDIATSATSSSGKIRRPNKDGKETGDTQQDIRCYNCSKYGHYQNACPSPRRPTGSCFTCHEMGHVNRNCPRRMSSTSVAVQQDEELEYAQPIHSIQESCQRKEEEEWRIDLVTQLEIATILKFCDKKCEIVT
uniref:CCHC-type domain-containing protein n=1 Tax=Anopheles minimus TaxID=112268 RepID=A0A182W3P0_9DIPT